MTDKNQTGIGKDDEYKMKKLDQMTKQLTSGSNIGGACIEIKSMPKLSKGKTGIRNSTMSEAELSVDGDTHAHDKKPKEPVL